MALLRKLLYKKPPDGLLDVFDRIYVFDSCFRLTTWEQEAYKAYMGNIITQLKETYPEASLMIFNFREGDTPSSKIQNLLLEQYLTIMDYPKQYAGCPLLSMEVIHHFLKSSESWLSLGQQNIILLHSEHGGWSVLAFLLAALLLYGKHCTAETRALEMVHEKALKSDILPTISLRDSSASQLRYLRYVLKRNADEQWPPADKALRLDCVIIRMIPDFDGKGGCCPVFRIYGCDPLLHLGKTPKLLFSTPRSKIVQSYNQAENELVKIDINCNIQGDIVLECINLHDDMVKETMMYRAMFNTAFIKSNTLMLSHEEIDVSWAKKNQFHKDFKAKLLFSEVDARASMDPVDLSCFEEEGLPIESLGKVQGRFSSVDWLVSKTNVALNGLHQMALSDFVAEKLGTSFQRTESTNLLKTDPKKNQGKEGTTVCHTKSKSSFLGDDKNSSGIVEPRSVSLPRQLPSSKQLPSMTPQITLTWSPPPPPPPKRDGGGGPPPPPPAPPTPPVPPAPPAHPAPKAPPAPTPPPPPPHILGPSPPPPPGSKGGGVAAPFPPSPIKKAPMLSRTTAVKSQPEKKLKPLHWSKMNRVGKGSLWAEAEKSGEDARTPKIDLSELEALFSASDPNSDKASKAKFKAANEPEKVQLIEHGRAHKCEIMLSKVKTPLSELMEYVRTLDDSPMDVDLVDNLIKFCPTKEEMELIRAYKGDTEKLGKCEQFFIELMKVPRSEAKLVVFSYKLQFSTRVSVLRDSLSNVYLSVEQIRSSIKLRRVMQTILDLGNALNQGTARGAAVGFRLDSLNKLNETRARSNKMTLMHYLCKVLADKLPELLDFSKELGSLEPASKIQLKILAEEMQAITKGLERVVQEKKLSKKDGHTSQCFRKSLKKFLASAVPDVQSLASLYTGTGHSVDALIIYFGEDPQRVPYEAVVSTLLSFVRMFNQAHEENCKQLEAEKNAAHEAAEQEKLNASEQDKLKVEETDKLKVQGRFSSADWLVSKSNAALNSLHQMALSDFVAEKLGTSFQRTESTNLLQTVSHTKSKSSFLGDEKNSSVTKAFSSLPSMTPQITLTWSRPPPPPPPKREGGGGPPPPPPPPRRHPPPPVPPPRKPPVPRVPPLPISKPPPPKSKPPPPPPASSANINKEGGAAVPPPPPPPGCGLKPLHWSKMNRVGKGSLWAEAEKSGETERTPTIDLSELEAFFLASDPNSDMASKAKSEAAKVQLIEHMRAYNCKIMLSKVKTPLPELMEHVLALDDQAMDVDQVDNLIKIYPTKEEMEQINAYKGDTEKLGKCEQFFMELMKVPRSDAKLVVFSYKLKFTTRVSDLRDSLSNVYLSVEQIRSSVKLRRVMQTILSLGNALNKGTAGGAAVGFRLDSLLMLNQIRATNSKMTPIHYLCKVLADQTPELLDFSQELGSLEPASKIQLKILAEEVQAITIGLEKVVQEKKLCEKDGHTSKRYSKFLKEFIASAVPDVQSLALLRSGVGKTVDTLINYFEENPFFCTYEAVVSTLFSFVRMFNQAHEENCKQIEAEKKAAHEAAEQEKSKAAEQDKLKVEETDNLKVQGRFSSVDWLFSKSNAALNRLHEMALSDFVAEKLGTSFQTDPKKNQGKEGTAVKSQRAKKLMPLHWTRIYRAGQGSLWAEAEKSGEAARTPKIDLSELEAFFLASDPKSDEPAKAKSKAANEPEKVQLIGHERAYKCEIMLLKVKLPLPELMEYVLCLDDSAMDVDLVDNLIKFCPTKEEMELIKGYKGDTKKLGKCEQFFMELMKVPRSEAKLVVFSYKLHFSTQVSYVRDSLNNLNLLAEQIRSSVKLRRVMHTILDLGNALNQGTARGAAVGFRLDSLRKLNEPRARSNKLTLMHYLCKVLADKTPELLDFSKELGSLEPASKIQLKILAEEMYAIVKGLERVVQEKKLSKKDGLVSKRFRKSLKKFLASAEPDVKALATLYSRLGKSVDALIIYFGEDPQRVPYESVVSTLFWFVRMFNQAHEENCKQIEAEKKKAHEAAQQEKLKAAEQEKSKAAEQDKLKVEETETLKFVKIPFENISFILIKSTEDFVFNLHRRESSLESGE